MFNLNYIPVTIFLTFLTVEVCKATVTNPIVKIPLGTVMGEYKESYEGRIVSSFEGIPYAKPPIGDLRFCEPQLPEPWADTLIANSTYMCMQHDSITTSNYSLGAEDCLYINVYVPRETIKADENLDVIVNIHGGGFTTGSATVFSGPDYLMDREVVYVNFNYRLSVFGFLSTEDAVVLGNNGLKDQVAALKWVKNYIHYFGGNPNSITIVGNSAGGASVHYHYLSPMSKGLFHRGFSSSGVALNSWALTKKPLKNAKYLSNIVGCTNESTKAMVDCLRNTPANTIAVSIVSFYDITNLTIMPFGPVVEKGPTSFLPEHPYKLLLDGKFHDHPWITSNTRDEGIGFAASYQSAKVLEDFNEHRNDILPGILDYAYTASKEDQVGITKELLRYYFNGKPTTATNFYNLSMLFSDRGFFIDTEKAIRLQAKMAKSPLYYYRFSYVPEVLNNMEGFMIGSMHGYDSALMFRVIIVPETLPKSDIAMKNWFIDFLYSYATTGKPSHYGVQWNPVGTSEDINYLHIESPEKISAKQIKQLGPTEFWNTLPIMENDKLYKTYQ